MAKCVPSWDAFLFLTDGTIVDQQINSSVVLKFAINAIVACGKPRIALHKGPDCPLGKADNGILRRGILRKPQVIDRIKTVLAEVALDGFSVNAVLYAGDLHMGLAIIRVRVCVSIGVLSGQMVGLHRCFPRNQPNIKPQ